MDLSRFPERNRIFNHLCSLQNGCFFGYRSSSVYMGLKRANSTSVACGDFATLPSPAYSSAAAILSCYITGRWMKCLRWNGPFHTRSIILSDSPSILLMCDFCISTINTLRFSSIPFCCQHGADLDLSTGLLRTYLPSCLLIIRYGQSHASR